MHSRLQISDRSVLSPWCVMVQICLPMCPLYRIKRVFPKAWCWVWSPQALGLTGELLNETLYFIQNPKRACHSHSLLQRAAERRTLQCLQWSADAVRVTAGSSLLPVRTPSPQKAQPTPVPPKGHVSDTGQISLFPPDYHCQDPNVPYTSLWDSSLIFIPWYPITQNFC